MTNPMINLLIEDKQLFNIVINDKRLSIYTLSIAQIYTFKLNKTKYLLN